MGTISLFFSQILEKQEQLGYHFPKILRQGASPESIAETEKGLGMCFNEELLELYQFADGTTIDSVTPSGLTGLIPIHNFLSLADTIDYYHQSMEFKESFHNWLTDFQPGDKLFPILEDGAGNCYWVDLNLDTPGYAKIFWTNTFGAEPDYAFTSLTAMFEVISEGYARGLFFLDEDGYLDYDFVAFDELSKGK